MMKYNKKNKLRNKSTLRRRNIKRKYSSKKGKKGGGGSLSALRNPQPQLWNPNMFFQTKYNPRSDCTKIAVHPEWETMMYNSLKYFFDNFPDTLIKPDDLEEVKTTYLSFYNDKKEWLVKQYCIFMNSPTLLTFTVPPTERFTEIARFTGTDDFIQFVSWLTNIDYIDSTQTRFRNETWNNIQAPSPYEYISSAVSVSGERDPLLANV